MQQMNVLGSRRWWYGAWLRERMMGLLWATGNSGLSPSITKWNPRDGFGSQVRLSKADRACASHGLPPIVDSSLTPLIYFRLATLLALITTVTTAPSSVKAQIAPSQEVKSERTLGHSLPVELMRQIVSLDEVMNPSQSADDGYQIHEYGPRPTYVSGFYWLDDHRLILNDIETIGKSERTSVIRIWNVLENSITKYGQGSVGCYADGKIRRTINQTGKSPTTPGVVQRGNLGQEMDVVYDKTIRVYDNRYECGDEPASLTTRYVNEHPEEIVVALRKEHGFLVRAKRTMFPDGRTNQIFEASEIVLHRPGMAPKSIPVPSKNLVVAAYYPFVDAYVLYNSATVLGEIHVLLSSGEVRTVRPPSGLIGSYPALTRRGLLWLRGSVLPKPDNGIYLSRGEQVKKIDSDNSHGGVVSPNGCRMAYTTSRVDFLGKITDPTLKVINLCTGDK